MRVRAGQPAASGPDPVHHEGGAVLEDAEVFFLHALRGVQEQVEVQVTGSLDLDFPAHALWEKHGGGSFLLLTCSLAKRLGRPCCQLSPAAPRGRARAACRRLPATTSTHPSSSGWDWWIQAGGTKRCPARGPRPQESRKSRVLWEEPPGSAWGPVPKSLGRGRAATHGGRWARSRSRPHRPGTPALPTLSAPDSRSSGS